MPADSSPVRSTDSSALTLDDMRHAAIVLVWMVVAFFAIASFALMIPHFFDWLQAVAHVTDTAEALMEIGLTPEIYATVIVVRDTIVTGFFMVTALGLFYRHSSDQWIVSVSLTLLTLGLGFTRVMSTPVLQPLDSITALVANLGHLFLVVFLFAFPDGRFRPRSAWMMATLLLAVNYGIQTLMILLESEPAILMQMLAGTQFGAIAVGILVQMYRYFKYHGPVERQQTKWLILGAATLVMGFVAINAAGIMTEAVTGSGAASVYYTLIFQTAFTALPALVVPISISFSVIQYRLWDLRRVVYSGSTYVLLVAVFMGGIFGGAILIQGAAPVVTAINVPASVVVSGLLMVLAAPVLYQFVRTVAHRTLLRERLDYRRVENEFSREIGTIIDLNELGKRLVRRVANLFVVSYIGVHLLKEENRLVLLEEKSLRYRMRFRTLDANTLANLGEGKDSTVFESGIGYLLVPIMSVKDRESDLVGILTLGPRISGQGFSTGERETLLSLATQVGTAIRVADLVVAITEAEREIKAAADTATLYLDLLTHDTRNQLQAILLAAEAIQQENPSSQTEALLNSIVDAVRACESLISKAQVTETFLSTELTALPLDQVVEEAMRRLGETYADIEVEVENHIPGTRVYADRHLLHMLMNLLENAVVHNKTQPRKVWVFVGRSDEGVTIRIADNGPGISDGKKEGLFDPDRRFGGVGVHQAQRICQKYGGRISVVDRVPGQPSHGAEFQVWLPDAEAEA
ncbi:MAG: GHKL domain-containing protein [Candidatus Thorarchaeota archaeon]|nr:MAG: GHKL domain-containing protein [Candidatus Thorarchaeota archaeon]